MDARLRSRERYTNQELLQGYEALEQEVLQTLFENDWTPELKIKNAIAKMDEMMQETDEAPVISVLMKLEVLLLELKKQIANRKCGMAGEKLVNNYLKTLNIKHSKIPNARIEINGSGEECDEIIITETQIFVLEVKWRERIYVIDEHGWLGVRRREPSRNLFASMIGKRYILRKVLLAELGPCAKDVPILPIIVFANRNANVIDETGILTWFYPEELTYQIEEMERAAQNDPKIDMALIAKTITSYSVDPTFRPAVDVDKIHRYLDQLHLGVADEIL